MREYPCFNKRWDEQLILALSAGDMDMKKMKWQNGKKSGQLTAFLLAGSILICLLSGCGSNGAKGDLADEAKSVETAETNAGSQVTAPGETAGMTSEPAGTAGTGQAKEAAESGETGAPAESKETAAAADSARIDEILSNMTLEEKIGQMMVVSFRVWENEKDTKKASVENTTGDTEGKDVTELNDEIRKCIAKYHFGGTILFAQNYTDPEQTLRLVADMQKANQEGGGLPLLVSTDQEGGYIVRMTYGTTGPGNMALTATGDPENARKMASIYAEELGLLGVHADYAPVLDTNNNPNNPVIGVRAFSDDPQTVAEYGTAYIEGLHDGGMIATIKHFPGHGNTDTDSHTGFPCIQSSYEELKSFELVPFQKAIDAGADMVMTAHIQYPKIETDTYTSKTTKEKVYLPATMSDTILTDILRGDMGFEGVVVTDALDMAAVTDNFSTEDTIRMTINAGADMLILPTIMNMSLYDKNIEMTEMAIRLARDGKISMDRIDESVRRILTLKQKYGLLDQTDFNVTEEAVNASVNGIGKAENRETAWEMAEQAVTVYKNDDGAYPVKMEDGQKALILFSDSAAGRAGAGELAKEMLTEKEALPKDADITIMVNTQDNEKKCLKAAKNADHVILVYRTIGADSLDPDTEAGFSSAVFDRVIEERHKAGKKVIFVSCQLPYDAARFPEADAIVLTYGSGLMEELPPKTGKNSAYMPNLPAALCACFGQGDANGSLPVTIPSLDKKYRMVVDTMPED